MKYKVGDKVKLKSKEGLDELKRQVGDLYIHPDAYKNAGSEQTILECNEDYYRYDASSRFWHVSLFEGLVEESLDKVMKRHQKLCDEIMAIQGIEPIEIEMEEDDIFDDTVPLPDSFVERMAHKIADSELFKADPLDIPTMTTDFVKEHGLPCPDGYIFKDENGNIINATKIVLEKKKKEYPQTDDIIKWLRECDMTKYIGVIYSGMCSITFDTEKLIKDITEMIGDE